MTRLEAQPTKSEGARTPLRARRKTWRRLALVLAVMAVAVALHLLFWRHHLKRFDVVRRDVLYRSGQPSEIGIWYAKRHLGVETLLNTRRYRKRLRSGIIEIGDEDGQFEEQYARSLGMQYVQWPQGDQKCWPWPTPSVFEDFFRLFDDPANYPVLVHCMGGRHRTGTISALFRLEYDRWPVERALAEMYSFHFGPPISIHEHNLRTYWPRPRPDDESWRLLRKAFVPLVGEVQSPRPDAYNRLIHDLRKRRGDPVVRQAIAQYIVADKPFALQLALRLIDSPEDANARPAVAHAWSALTQSNVSSERLASASALIADFGTPEEQQTLLDLLSDRDSLARARYEAIVTGVTNRYTKNRLPYLRPLLDDQRNRTLPAARKYRYCDAAVARLSVIIDRNFVEYPGKDGGILWDRGRTEAKQWFADHPDEAKLRTLVLPEDASPVQADPNHPEAIVAQPPESAETMR